MWGSDTRRRGGGSGVAACLALALVTAAGLGGQATASPERLAYLSEQGASSAPLGWRQFCRDMPAECRTRPRSVEVIRTGGTAWATIIRINAHVNTAIEPVTDIDQYGREEVWTYPTSGRGDCEDYVLLKKKLLVEAGLPESALLVTVVRDRQGDGHAVLTVRTDRGDYVLDNETSDIRLWHQTGYRFVKRQSSVDPNLWVTVGPGTAPASVATR
ncbi:transglutaminase-like cysteine peptidase [Phreatobacter oligotrophus]|uniref:Putative transglutaminase-like cysteine proteinase n=1 Tax=Phreatobacter oligotrophus TaxID=1122261 RepID=A0A2T4YZH7_9HYPH|nr:transglutaminase-like cysteine peptidase [Phreatobacter oligotrophus]PTM52377.1 putative transglutaminase-like cysteine proteinase [Phreatobacter oligotrophus]